MKFLRFDEISQIGLNSFYLKVTSEFITGNKKEAKLIDVTTGLEIDVANEEIRKIETVQSETTRISIKRFHEVSAEWKADRHPIARQWMQAH